MPLHYNCGNGWVKTRIFAKKNLNSDVYLCCTGPSFADVDVDSLRAPGVFTIGLNTVYPRIRPDLWIGMDDPACYHADLWWESFPKVMRSKYKGRLCSGVPITDCPSVYFADVQTNINIKQMFSAENRKHDVQFIFNYSSFLFAIHFAIWMGARKIHLLGCDFGGSKDYFDDRQLTDKQKNHNQKLYKKLVGLLGILRAEGEKHGVEILSCTADSPANQHLKYIPLEEALEASKTRVPEFVTGEVVHALDAEQCRWKGARSGRGVITGVDRHQEWLLPWWYENLRKHNPDIEVGFADFGMSDIMKVWCHGKGKRYEVPEKVGKLAWHKKPFALLRSPFEETAWLDADCEVRKPVDELFDYLDGIGLTLDSCNRFCRYATGVVVCRAGEPAVQEWAKEIKLRKYRGDQEAFHAIHERLKSRIREMPSELQWLRLQDRNLGATIMHWTGQQGKQKIAELKVAG